mgnify:CR=1 FL=1|jgi:hypothetical protein
MNRTLFVTPLVVAALLGLIYLPIAPLAGLSFAEMGERAGVENVPWEDSAGETVLQLLEQPELSKILLSDEIGGVKKTSATLGKNTLGLNNHADFTAALKTIATWADISRPMWGQNEVLEFNNKEFQLFALLWDSCSADSPVWTGYARLLIGQLQHGDPAEVATSVRRMSLMLKSSETWRPETLAVFNQLPDNWLTLAVLRENQRWDEYGMFDVKLAQLVVRPSRFEDLQTHRLWQQFYIEDERFMMNNAELLLEVEDSFLAASEKATVGLCATSNGEDFVELEKQLAKLR